MEALRRMGWLVAVAIAFAAVVLGVLALHQPLSSIPVSDGAARLEGPSQVVRTTASEGGEVARALLKLGDSGEQPGRSSAGPSTWR